MFPVIIQQKKMKKQSNNFTTESRKNVTGKKNTRYVYTEEDLGEGILYAGIVSSYTAGKQKNLNPQNNYSRPYLFL